MRLVELLSIRRDRAIRREDLIAAVPVFVLLASCGGGGSGGTTSPPPPPPVTYTAKSGVAQKGPLQLGSTVTAQELDAKLSPTGKQYSYQITSDLGTFSPTSTFGSQYIGVIATGYYFDEIANAASTGTVTLNGYNDLSAESVLNVNLLTTVAYQRIQKLVGSGMAFAAAQTQAENEVLAAFNIPNGSQYGVFGALDISQSNDGDNILAAVSSMFLYAGGGGSLSALIASIQSDIGSNGAITSSVTKSALTGAAAAFNPTVIAANLTQKYSSDGVKFQPSQLSSWIDADGVGVVGKFKFQVTSATPTTSFTLPQFVAQSAAGESVSVTAGQLSVNGTPISGAVTLNASDIVSVSPGTSSFASNGVLDAFLTTGSTKVARVRFIAPTADVWLPAAKTAGFPDFTPAVTLQNGQILGFYDVDCCAAVGYFSGSELYDLATNTWNVSGQLSIARYDHTATLLANGKVLAVAGSDPVSGSSLQDVELYDPSAGTWSPTGSLAVARVRHTATLLPSGKVLVTGGTWKSGVILASAELYDPSTGMWSAAADMASARVNHTATLLASGLVLVAGGNYGGMELSTAELYDPANNTWSAAGSLTTARANHSATLLQNGSVLLVGGTLQTGDATASTDLYNPATNTFTASGNLANARYGHAAALLASSKVLAVGGAFGSGNNLTSLASAEVFDPSTGSWTSAASMASARMNFATAVVPGGGVLVAGGVDFVNGNGGGVSGSEIHW